MPRALGLRPFVTGVASFLLLVPVSCGGDGGSNDETAAKKPPRSAEIPPPRLPSDDRRSYARLQRASGALRAAAVPVAYGAAPRIDTGRLSRPKRRLSATHPRNARLRRLRDSTLAALNAAIAGGQGTSAKAVATEAIGEADRIDAGLRRFAASHPAANEIAPG